ncbi:carboxylating nicotinate-nucleotide diphosphorylase [Acidocella sp.]|uniref:carboxylating nicotinate-nucleotide diphosphorylase n=1 Tax=Acidocella sp. TaxID=50710 RepID=UPI002626EA97|nr:carboxylating nicotinate-nucleotide diphosphorylase [Acidocella sp.]MDD2794440.1 carboxylating nicotinate-nucleotide diphosphorylase [Acidocella sp.]
MIPYLLVEQAVREGLLEDLGRAGDITTEAVVPPERQAVCTLVARDPGVVAGLDFARAAFGLIDRSIVFTAKLPDASRVTPGEVIAEISGSARGILTAERVALNFLGPLSGIATATRGIADAITHTKARITCTRKTTPGLRFAQKYAVRCGGGANHRFGLDDAILIKDNHIALAGGIAPALRAAKRAAGHLVKIEIEVDTLAQLQEVLHEGVDAVLLDNMDTAQLRQAVAMINGRAIAEASGRITPASAAAIAETGVELISAGWLTHSAKVLDIGLDFVRVS